MPVQLNQLTRGYLLPTYWSRVVIPQASVRTLFSAPVIIVQPNINECPWIEYLTFNKQNGIAYSGSSSANIIIDAVDALAVSTAVFSFPIATYLGITSGIGASRNPGSAEPDFNPLKAFGKYYQIRLQSGGSDFNAGTGDLILDLFIKSVLKNPRV